MKAFDIIAYQYRADTYCPDCIISEVMARRPGDVAPALADMAPEAGLDQVAEYLTLDRMDERSFDSDDFPKVVFASQVEDTEHCGHCHGEIS